MVTCPSCGRENPEGSRFCNACGAELAGRRDDAVPVLEEALARYEQKGNVVMIERTRALLTEHA
jgi:uncharacterized membrane protein YvbJ